jgi:kynurenine formamidase
VTQEQIHSASRTDVNSLQPWTTRNLAGRGVLIDYAAYAKRQGISYEAFSAHPITIADVEAIAKEQGVTFNTGDVLFLRTGYVASYKAADQAKRELAAEGKWVGLSQGREAVEWLWNKQFAALVADCPGFEMIRELTLSVANGLLFSLLTLNHPAPADHDWFLHPIVLSGWGTPLGELFDLEALSALCEKNKRWSFFFTSSPLNYTGAVASPPNATAIM